MQKGTKTSRLGPSIVHANLTLSHTIHTAQKKDNKPEMFCNTFMGKCEGYCKFPPIQPPPSTLISSPVMSPPTCKQKNTSGHKPPRIYVPPFLNPPPPSLINPPVMSLSSL